MAAEDFKFASAADAKAFATQQAEKMTGKAKDAWGFIRDHAETIWNDATNKGGSLSLFVKKEKGADGKETLSLDTAGFNAWVGRQEQTVKDAWKAASTAGEEKSGGNMWTMILGAAAVGIPLLMSMFGGEGGGMGMGMTILLGLAALIIGGVMDGPDSFIGGLINKVTGGMLGKDKATIEKERAQAEEKARGEAVAKDFKPLAAGKDTEVELGDEKAVIQMNAAGKATLVGIAHKKADGTFGPVVKVDGGDVAVINDPANAANKGLSQSALAALLANDKLKAAREEAAKQAGAAAPAPAAAPGTVQTFELKTDAALNTATGTTGLSTPPIGKIKIDGQNYDVVLLDGTSTGEDVAFKSLALVKDGKIAVLTAQENTIGLSDGNKIALETDKLNSYLKTLETHFQTAANASFKVTGPDTDKQLALGEVTINGQQYTLAVHGTIQPDAATAGDRNLKVQKIDVLKADGTVLTTIDTTAPGAFTYQFAIDKNDRLKAGMPGAAIDAKAISEDNYVIKAVTDATKGAAPAPAAPALALTGYDAKNLGKEQHVSLDMGTIKVDGKDYHLVATGTLSQDGKKFQREAYEQRDADGKVIATIPVIPAGTKPIPAAKITGDNTIAVTDGKIAAPAARVDAIKAEYTAKFQAAADAAKPAPAPVTDFSVNILEGTADLGKMTIGKEEYQVVVHGFNAQSDSTTNLFTPESVELINSKTHKKIEVRGDLMIAPLTTDADGKIADDSAKADFRASVAGSEPVKKAADKDQAAAVTPAPKPPAPKAVTQDMEQTLGTVTIEGEPFKIVAHGQVTKEGDKFKGTYNFNKVDLKDMDGNVVLQGVSVNPANLPVDPKTGGISDVDRKNANENIVGTIGGRSGDIYSAIQSARASAAPAPTPVPTPVKPAAPKDELNFTAKPADALEVADVVEIGGKKVTLHGNMHYNAFNSMVDFSSVDDGKGHAQTGAEPLHKLQFHVDAQDMKDGHLDPKSKHLHDTIKHMEKDMVGVLPRPATPPATPDPAGRTPK